MRSFDTGRAAKTVTQRGSKPLPKAIAATSTRGEKNARAAASARSSAAASVKAVPAKAKAATSTRGEAKARAAAKARTAVSAGSKKTVQTGIMNKNRAIKGKMSYVGNQPAKPVKASALSRQNAMSKNRASRGAMGR